MTLFIPLHRQTHHNFPLLSSPMPTLHFKGKAFVQHHHLVVSYHELVPVKSKGLSLRASLHDTP